MHALLRPAGDQMYDTRAWRGPAVVGGDGIDRRYPLSQRNTPQAVEDFCFCALAPLRHAGGPRLSLLVTTEQTYRKCYRASPLADMLLRNWRAFGVAPTD